MVNRTEQWTRVFRMLYIVVDATACSVRLEEAQLMCQIVFRMLTDVSWREAGMQRSSERAEMGIED